MLIKHLSEDISTAQIVFFRNIFALMLLPWVMSTQFALLKTQRIGLHFLRATVGISGMACLYYAWGHLPLAQAALLKQTAPFFVPLIAFFWLAEKIDKTVLIAIVVGFLGVYFILRPEQGDINSAVLVALLGAMLGAFAKVIVRKLSSTEGARIIVFYSGFFGSFIALIPALYYWQNMTVEVLLWLLLLAVTSTIAQLSLSKAYRLSKAAVLAPFTYSSVFYAVLFGWLFWAESINYQTLIGITLIFCAGLIAYKANSAKTS